MRLCKRKAAAWLAGVYRFFGVVWSEPTERHAYLGRRRFGLLDLRSVSLGSMNHINSPTPAATMSGHTVDSPARGGRVTLAELGN